MTADKTKRYTDRETVQVLVTHAKHKQKNENIAYYVSTGVFLIHDSLIYFCHCWSHPCALITAGVTLLLKSTDCQLSLRASIFTAGLHSQIWWCYF